MKQLTCIFLLCLLLSVATGHNWAGEKSEILKRLVGANTQLDALGKGLSERAVPSTLFRSLSDLMKTSFRVGNALTANVLRGFLLRTESLLQARTVLLKLVNVLDFEMKAHGQEENSNNQTMQEDIAMMTRIFESISAGGLLLKKQRWGIRSLLLQFRRALDGVAYDSLTIGTQDMYNEVTRKNVLIVRMKNYKNK